MEYELLVGFRSSWSKQFYMTAILKDGLFSVLSSPDTFNQKEGKLEETQMRLLDKEERNLDKQIEKLNLEIDMLNKKLAL